jgi:hypothetical protein
MTSSPHQLQICSSPKRKRGEPESIEYSPQASPRISRISTKPRGYPVPGELREESGRLEDGSPSSRVTGQLRTLDLQGAFVGQITSNDAEHAKKRLAQSGEGLASQNATTRPSNEDQCASQQPESAMNIVPSSGNLGVEASTFSSTIVDRPRAHSRSPPLNGDAEDNPMTWHESEITGHHPTDPTDDGYGINGIGFKPTPAIAWARSQKRNQQLEDYRNREAREARQRRSERRAGSAETSVENAAKVKKRNVKVRFRDTGSG